MTRDDGAFVRRDTLINYLEDFADMIDVPIRFDTAVQSIGQTEHGWKLETDKGALEAMHVIVTTGREKIPHVPDWPGRSDFDGDILHLADLGDIGRFSRRRILVIGAGNSGSDVLNHLAGIDTADVWISLRHGPAIIPARLFGFPMHRLARLFEQVPGRLLDRMLSLTQRLVFGDLSQFGFRSHPVGGGTRLWRDGILPAIDSGFVAAVKQGRMRIVGETVRFDRCSVHFAEGTSIEREIVIGATGYRSGLEPLFGRLKVLDGEGHPWRGLGEPDPHHRGLWFTGYKAVFPGYFHAAKIAAQRIAQGVVNGTGEVVGPRQTPSRHSRPVQSLAVST